MSAPSKEEIAALVRVVAFQCGSGEAAQVADLADENERLRAELDREARVMHETKARLAIVEAERAECLALLADEQAGNACCEPNAPGEDDPEHCDGEWDEGGAFLGEVCWMHRCRALLAKLRGQQP